MSNPVQYANWISRTCLRAASAALTLAVVLALGVVATRSAQAQTFTVLHNFTGSKDGGNPYAGLTLDEAGNLYSTTELGGTSNYGTVWQIRK